MNGNQTTIPLNEYNRLTDTAAKVDKLADTNGALCAEINRQERVIEDLQLEKKDFIRRLSMKYESERDSDKQIKRLKVDNFNLRHENSKLRDLVKDCWSFAAMMYDCWIEECKAGECVDISAVNAYLYELDQLDERMAELGITEVS